MRAREAALARLRDESESSRAKAEEDQRELQSLYFQTQDRLAELERQSVEAETRLFDLQGELEQASADLKSTLDELQGAQGETEREREAARRVNDALSEEQRISEAARRQIHLLNLQIADLREQLASIQALLDDFEAKDKESQAAIADLGRRLNKALASQVEKLARYRSDFFGRLREVLKNEKGIRIVGDRFVFQSEVLFRIRQRQAGRGRSDTAHQAGRDAAQGDARYSRRHRLGTSRGRTHGFAADQDSAIPVKLGTVGCPCDRSRQVPQRTGHPRQPPCTNRIFILPPA